MKLDHFVVHIDNDETILDNLKQRIEPLGFPFEPTWGKGTKGFKAANIWIGRQYFEIVHLLKPDGGGWPLPWVKRYNEDKRGLCCLYLATDNIEKIANTLRGNGIAVQGPERISFKILFGLWKKTLPWQLIYLPPLPGTDFEIGFIQYDPDPKDRMKQFLVPNSDENGITGVHSATVQLPMSAEAKSFLAKIFPTGQWHQDMLKVDLVDGQITFSDASDPHLTLQASVQNDTYAGNSFTLENVTIHT